MSSAPGSVNLGCRFIQSSLDEHIGRTYIFVIAATHGARANLDWATEPHNFTAHVIKNGNSIRRLSGIIVDQTLLAAVFRKLRLSLQTRNLEHGRLACPSFYHLHYVLANLSELHDSKRKDALQSGNGSKKAKC